MEIPKPGKGQSVQGWADWLTERGSAGVLRLEDPADLPPGLRSACEPDGLFWAAREPEANHLVATAAGLRLSLDGDLVSEQYDDQGRISRSLNTAERHARHERFFLPEGAGGKGLGRAMLERSVALYRGLGLDRITLRAEQIGKYAWAQLGFEFADDEDREKVNEAVRRFARDEVHFWDDPPYFHEPWHVPLIYDRDPENEKVFVPADLINTALEERYQQHMFAPPRVEGAVLASKALLLYADYDHWDGIFRLDTKNGGFQHFWGNL
jgi:GNAT superfamily N-acetyltransferase